MTTTSQDRVPGYETVVDLARYPIHEPGTGPYQALVRSCQDQLRDRGVAQLERLPHAGRGHRHARPDRAAGWPGHGPATRPTPSTSSRPTIRPAPDHPRALLQHSAKKAIAYDLIPADVPIRRLYESGDLTVFIAAVLGKPVLYRSADPLDALEIAVFGDGDELGWHFDNSEFSVTMMYAESEAGGHFDYCPRLRDEHDENYAGRPEGPARATRAASSGCPAARARSRSSAASTPCTGSPRSAARGRGSTRC